MATNVMDAMAAGEEYWSALQPGDIICSIICNGQIVRVVPYFTAKLPKRCWGALVQEGKKRKTNLLPLDPGGVLEMINNGDYITV